MPVIRRWLPRDRHLNGNWSRPGRRIFRSLGAAPKHSSTIVGNISTRHLQIKVYGAGELVPALQVFDAVSQGTAEMGHSGAYYWKGKATGCSFYFGTVRSDPCRNEQLDSVRWRPAVVGRSVRAVTNLLPLPGVIPVCRWAVGFNKEINSVSDLEGHKCVFRVWAVEVLARAGVRR